MLLSRTYRPSSGLAPYIRRYYVFEAELLGDTVIEDFLLAETAFVRCLLKGEWQCEVAPGNWSRPDKMLFFGTNEKPFKVRVRGSFKVVGFAIRPSGWHSLFTCSHSDYTDKLLPLRRVWGSLADKLQSELRNAGTDEALIAAMEVNISEKITEFGRPDTDPATAQLEAIARTDSTVRVEDIATAVGLSVRQLERLCLRPDDESSITPQPLPRYGHSHARLKQSDRAGLGRASLF